MCSRRPVQTKLDEELVVRLSGKGKKLVRQRAPVTSAGTWRSSNGERLEESTAGPGLHASK